MPDTKDPATVLEEAADLLLIRGRSIGTEGEDGEVCVLGAIGVVREDDAFAWCSGDLNDDPAVQAISQRIGQWSTDDVWNGTDPDVVNVFTWNDSTRDDDEVRDTLLLAAKDLRNEAASARSV